MKNINVTAASQQVAGNRAEEREGENETSE